MPLAEDDICFYHTDHLSITLNITNGEWLISQFVSYMSLDRQLWPNKLQVYQYLLSLTAKNLTAIRQDYTISAHAIMTLQKLCGMPLTHHMELENFSGKTAKAARYDFRAKVFLSTLCATYTHNIR